jgi:ABC-type dipeptide/oligopeptide/nickel transport system ATPase component
MQVRTRILITQDLELLFHVSDDIRTVTETKYVESAEILEWVQIFYQIRPAHFHQHRVKQSVLL